MTVDPETLRQIEALSQDRRPLLVSDVDEVVLDFVDPFTRFLASRGYRFASLQFRLTGNVVDTATGALLDAPATDKLLGDFFADQAAWQVPAAGAVAALSRLAERVEIVLLTAMPHRYHEVRRRHLVDLGVHWPLLTTEMAKGPALRRLRGDSGRRVAFVDDLPPNLVSVGAAVPDAHLFHLMAHAGLRALLPPLPPGIVAVADWAAAEPAIAAALLAG